MEMDSVLTEFIQRTKADPALAQDLLEATEWNLDLAVMAFGSLQETKVVEPPEYVYDPKDFESIRTVPEEREEMVDSDLAEMRNSNMDENEAKRREIVKRKKFGRSRGLSFEDAGEVIDKFSRVAVGKERVGSQEQVIFDEKFFHHSFVYPNISQEKAELQDYITKDLLEISHKRALERSGRLNWWTSTGRLPELEPLATSGDGNCLLHAASLYMWGLHDHSLILRTALHRLLTSGVEKEGIKRRWKYQTQLRNDEAGGLKFTEEEWDFEWGEILHIATNKPRQQPTTDSLRRHSSLRMSYESLEEIHISVLAHTLRRPIVVISDRTIKDLSGQDLAPIYFGGIYLPLEVNPTVCHKSPVVLAYDSSHFSPLVAIQDLKSGKQKPHAKYARMSSRVETVIPLVTPDGSLLPVQFIYDPKKRDVQEKWSRMEYEVGEFPDDIIRLLESYMNVRWIQLKVSSTDSRVSEDYDHVFPVKVPKVRFPAASIVQEAQPIYQEELIEKYLKHIRTRFEEEKETKARREADREEEERKRLLNKIVPCEGEGCEMFGRPATNNLCSLCYQKSLCGLGEDPQPPESQDFVPPDPPIADEEPDLHKTMAPHPQQESHDLIARGGQPPPDYADSHRAIFQTKPAPGRVATRVSPNHSATDRTETGLAAGKRPQAPLQPVSNITRKQPPLPPDQARSRSHTPDENTPKSRSPTPPPKPPKSPPTSTPPHPSKGSAPPPPSKMALPVANSAPPSTTKSPTKWVSNLMFKKPSPTHSKSQSKGGKYSRDNILPLHLESASPDPSPDPDSQSGATTGRDGDVTAVKSCKTVNCVFFWSPGCAGYCSSCFKVLKNNATVL